jgi:hypothetical protein
VEQALPQGQTGRTEISDPAQITHLCRKLTFEYRRGFARLLDMPFGRQEVTINIASAAALYKKLVTSTEGYVGEAPIIHQAVALKAAIDAMDSEFPASLHEIRPA